MTLNQAATRIAANAAAVATAMAGGTTTAEASALATLLATMTLRPGEATPLLRLAMDGNTPNTNLTAF